MTLKKCFLTFVMFDNTGKLGQKFCHLKTSVFWNVCFYRPVRSKRNDEIFCTIIVEILVDSYKMLFPEIFMFDNRRKNRPQCFFHWKDGLFFSKICVFINLLGHKKIWSYYFHSNCHKTLWTLINCSLRFLILDKRRKNGQTIFFCGKVSPFFKNLF